MNGTIFIFKIIIFLENFLSKVNKANLSCDFKLLLREKERKRALSRWLCYDLSYTMYRFIVVW